MENTEGKSVAKVLGIDKPDEWLTEQSSLCHESLVEDTERFSTIINNFLFQSGEIPFMLSVKLNDFGRAVTSLVELFYTVGYMKGKVDQEKIGGLDKLWGKEEF